jgi:hypothetical protein
MTWVDCEQNDKETCTSGDFQKQLQCEYMDRAHGGAPCKDQGSCEVTGECWDWDYSTDGVCVKAYSANPDWIGVDWNTPDGYSWGGNSGWIKSGSISATE